VTPIVESVADGGAASFHARDLPVDGVPRLWWFEPSRPAVVLGSTQDQTILDRGACARLGVDVVKRRSGGGVVLVGSQLTRWLDVLVPRGHRRWDDDVSRSAWWIGEVWAEVLSARGFGEVSVHRGAMVTSPMARLVCFAGRGPGEVFIGEAKAVGISQRRTRDWSRFQCALSVRWDAATHASVMADPMVTEDSVAGLGTTLSLADRSTLDRLVDEVTAALAERLTA
jgi:lipoate-protein ligase A